MALVGHLHKIVWGGTLATTEQWSCSIHFISPSAGVLDKTLFEAAIEDWMQRPDSRVSTLAKFEWLKINEIDPLTSLYLDPAVANTYFQPVPISGTGGTDWPHVSLAVTTQTAKQRGRAHAGRFFPPVGGLSGSVAGDGRIPIATVTPVATSAAQLVTDFNGAGDGECYVWSKVGQEQQEITGVRVGRVGDVQNRRRKNLIEDYQSAPVS